MDPAIQPQTAFRQKKTRRSRVRVLEDQGGNGDDYADAGKSGKMNNGVTRAKCLIFIQLQLGAFLIRVLIEQSQTIQRRQ